MSLPSSAPPAVAYVVLDASAMIALCAQEPERYNMVQTVVENYANSGSAFYAPNVIVSEVLFAVCRKLGDGTLTEARSVALSKRPLPLKSIQP